MTQSITSVKSNDFFGLRATAMEWLQNSSAGTWTDFNTHDPGITILETAIYALSELGYKANLDIDQLIGRSKGFLRPEEVMYNAPVTIADYSRYLMQHPLVKRANVARLNCPENRIFLADGGMNIVPAFSGAGSDEIQLKGMYKVLVELRKDNNTVLPEENRDLNDNIVKVFHQPVIDGAQTYFYALDFYFPYWDELPEYWRSPTGINLASAVLETTEKENIFFATLDLDLQTDFGSQADTIGLYIIATPETGQPVPPPLLLPLQALIKSHLENTAAGAVPDIFIYKARMVSVKMEEVRRHMMRQRNLCEDFASIQLCKIQEIAINIDIRLEPGVIPEIIMAKILYELDRYINPPLETDRIQDLKNAALPPDTYMEGPAPGTDQIVYRNLEVLNAPRSIIASDIIHMLLDIPAIASVENLNMSSYSNGQAIAVNENDCLALISTVYYKPIFSRTKSAIRLLSGGTVLQYDPAQVSAEELKLSAAVISSLNTIMGGESTIPDLIESDYYSLQHDFPAVYGLGAGELSSDTSVVRMAQSKQLKAYLLLFDQLLANGLAQASQINDFFSTDPSLSATMPVQVPADIDGLSTIITTDFEKATRSLENDDAFFIRRNKILNHLLGRLGYGEENFRALSFLKPADNLPVIAGRNLGGVQLTFIKEKSAFLENFSPLSAERFRGCVYTAMQGEQPEDVVWDTANVSCVEKRIAIFLGLTGYNRRSPALNEDTIYLIEHILLRPTTDESDIQTLLLADISDSDGKVFGADRDAYSFRSTLLLPGYHTRFSTTDTKIKAEQVITLEMPAHLSFDIFWAKDPGVMTTAASILKEWLILKATPVPPTAPARQVYLDNLKSAQIRMVKLLNFLRGLKYPFDIVGGFYELKSPPFIFDVLPPI